MIEECRDKQRQAEQERDYALSHQKKVEIPVEKPVLYQKCGNCNQTAYLKAKERYDTQREKLAGRYKTKTAMYEALTILLVLTHNIFSAVAFPFADPLGKGLRATGDVKFTTVISLFTTIGVRLVFSVLFGIVLDMGVMGIAYAMCLDWIIRGIIFWWRFKQGKWKQCKVI